MTEFGLLEEEEDFTQYAKIVYHNSFNHELGKLHLRLENFEENQLEIIDFIIKKYVYSHYRLQSVNLLVDSTPEETINWVKDNLNAEKMSKVFTKNWLFQKQPPFCIIEQGYSSYNYHDLNYQKIWFHIDVLNDWYHSNNL